MILRRQVVSRTRCISREVLWMPQAESAQVIAVAVMWPSRIPCAWMHGDSWKPGELAGRIFRLVNLTDCTTCATRGGRVVMFHVPSGVRCVGCLQMQSMSRWPG